MSLFRNALSRVGELPLLSQCVARLARRYHPASLPYARAARTCFGIWVVCTILCAEGNVLAQPAAPPGGIESYWGTLPEPSDSVTARFVGQGSPLWERTLLVPYRIVSLPFRGLSAGMATSLIYLDDHRVVYRVRRLVGPRRGPFGFMVSAMAGGMTRWGGGVTLVHDSFLSPANAAKLRLQITSDQGRRATFGFSRGRGDGFQSDLGLGYRLLQTARYYGLGPRSRKDRESLYQEETSWAALGHTHRWASGVAVETRAMISGIGARNPSNRDFPPLAETFAEELPDGYGRRSDAVSLSLALRHDTAREDRRPAGGGVRRATVARTDGIGSGRSSFWTFRGDADQFLPLWNSGQVLALRGFLSWSEAIGGSQIPFQRLMTNDDPDILRGYQDLRFRDRGMTAATIEYRWPIWAERAVNGLGVDAYLLGDFGQVFGSRRDLALDQFTVSYGGGLRFLSASSFVGRLEFAWSDEEMRIRLRADQVFQFSRGGLYHGRNPIPLR